MSLRHRIANAFRNWRNKYKKPTPYVLAFIEAYKTRPEDFREQSREVLHDNGAHQTLFWRYGASDDGSISPRRTSRDPSAWVLRPDNVSNQHAHICLPQEVQLLCDNIPHIERQGQRMEGQASPSSMEEWTKNITDCTTRYQEEVGAN